MLSKGSNNAITIISRIAAAGVVIGAMSLFIVLSGFAGLKDFSLQFSSYFDPDLKIFPASSKTFTFSDKQKEQLKKIAEVVNYSEIIEERVFLEYREKNTMAFIKGVDAQYSKIIVPDSILFQGSWLNENDYYVVPGFGISNALSMGVGDTRNLLQMTVLKPGKGQVKLTDASKAFNKKSVVPIGIFNVNEDLDKKYVFSTLSLARQLLNIDENNVTHIELKLTPQADENTVTQKVQAIFGSQVVIKNSIQLNETLYKMLNTENLAVYLIFTLVLIIALFNLVGAIIMMVIDKKQNIITLYNLGTPLRAIRRIFLLQGVLMTFFGGMLGLFLGFVIIALQQHFNLLMITASLPYPTKITATSFVVVFLTIFILGMIASLLASSRINKRLVKAV